MANWYLFDPFLEGGCQLLAHYLLFSAYFPLILIMFVCAHHATFFVFLTTPVFLDTLYLIVNSIKITVNLLVIAAITVPLRKTGTWC